MATKYALKMADYTVTEAGFGADLGAEKFLDIKCRFTGFKPDAVVIVATIRALKMHGGLAKTELATENIEALKKGMTNLAKHIENIQKFGLSIVVAINAFPTDTENELQELKALYESMGASVSISEAWAKGGEGAIDLAQKVIEATEKPSNFQYMYDVNDSIKDKINAIATKIYGADGVNYTPAVEKLSLNLKLKVLIKCQSAWQKLNIP